MSLFSGPEESSRRMRICATCEKFKHNIKICGICKCFMPFKTKVMKAHCPLKNGKMNLEHKHLIVRAEVAGTPLLQDLKFIEDWVRRLIHDVGMVILIEPQVAYCDQENNRGVTAIAALTTSSCSLHIWDEALPPYVQFDLYSCKDFDVDDALNALKEFGMTRYEYIFIDRETFKQIHAKGYDTLKKRNIE